MKATSISTSEYVSISTTGNVDIDLGGGLTAKATAYLLLDVVTTLAGVDYVSPEVQDIEIEYFIGGKRTKYAGFKNLYQQLFGEQSMSKLEKDIDTLVTESLEKEGYGKYVDFKKLPVSAMRVLINNKLQGKAASWGGMLYTSAYDVLQLVKTYNSLDGSRHIPIKTSQKVPPSWILLREDTDVRFNNWEQSQKNNPVSLSYISLSAAPCSDGSKKVFVQDS